VGSTPAERTKFRLAVTQPQLLNIPAKNSLVSGRNYIQLAPTALSSDSAVPKVAFRISEDKELLNISIFISKKSVAAL
jgi:hypothetical protein